MTGLDKKQRVLWLVAGGSALDLAVLVASKLKHHRYIGLLTVSLTDERYGQVGHKDSNWQQLMDRGFNLPGAQLIPVLEGKDFQTTAKNYSQMLNQQLKMTDYSIALAGMGADGHIFGIKPGSPSVDSSRDVVDYEWDDYQRLTPTIKLIKKMDEVVFYTVGSEKHQQFDRLDLNLDPDEQPAQLIKQLKKVTIFNDYKGDAA